MAPCNLFALCLVLGLMFPRDTVALGARHLVPAPRTPRTYAWVLLSLVGTALPRWESFRVLGGALGGLESRFWWVCPPAAPSPGLVGALRALPVLVERLSLGLQRVLSLMVVHVVRYIPI
jgi:hypothetical protein